LIIARKSPLSSTDTDLAPMDFKLSFQKLKMPDFHEYRITNLKTSLGELPPAVLALACVGLLTSLIILRTLLRAVLDPCRSLPGPFWARFTRFWLFKQTISGEFNHRNIAMHRKYGERPTLISASSENFYSKRSNMNTKVLSFALHRVTTPLMTPRPLKSFIPDLFSDRNQARHAINRRYVAGFFSLTNQLKMEEQVQNCIAKIDGKFREIAMGEQAVNLTTWLQCYAFDVIAEITVRAPSSALGSVTRLTDGKDKLNMFDNTHKSLVYVTYVSAYYEIHPVAFAMLKRFGTNGLLGVFDFTWAHIKERLKTIDGNEIDSDKSDFLTRVLALHKKDPKFTMDHVFAACMQNIGAGSDTTSISLSAIMGNLIENPRTLEKLRAEIDEKVAAGELSDPPAFKETQKMPYLQAVIHEALRIHSAVGFPVERLVPQGGLMISSQFFPEGTIVATSPWVSAYNKSVYGEDVEVFRPERWMVDKDQYAAMDRSWLPVCFWLGSFLPLSLSSFGYGPRSCLGKNISLMEMGKLVPHLVRKFNFALANTDTKLESTCMGFVKHKNFMVKISEREK
ncbi:uncharacterized protein N7482_000024, partial [Penicillium canariense]